MLFPLAQLCMMFNLLGVGFVRLDSGREPNLSGSESDMSTVHARSWICPCLPPRTRSSHVTEVVSHATEVASHGTEGQHEPLLHSSLILVAKVFKATYDCCLLSIHYAEQVASV